MQFFDQIHAALDGVIVYKDISMKICHQVVEMHTSSMLYSKTVHTAIASVPGPSLPQIMVLGKADLHFDLLLPFMEK